MRMSALTYRRCTQVVDDSRPTLQGILSFPFGTKGLQNPLSWGNTSISQYMNYNFDLFGQEDCVEMNGSRIRTYMC